MSCMKIGFILHLMGLCTDLFTSHLSDGTHVSIYVEVKNSWGCKGDVISSTLQKIEVLKLYLSEVWIFIWLIILCLPAYINVSLLYIYSHNLWNMWVF